MCLPGCSGGDELEFARWDGDRVALWLHKLGLSMYVGECRRWVRHGDHLLHASPHDLEKELGMRNALHRKKLALALAAVARGPGGMEPTAAAAARLDHNWVTRKYKHIIIGSHASIRIHYTGMEISSSHIIHYTYHL
jgi:hypothetical protein